MKSKVVRILFYLAASVASLGISSCSGNTDPDADKLKLTLSSDKTELVADGEDHAVFTVLYGIEDVTDKAQINCTEGNGKVSSGTFTPYEAGSYTFTASYDGVTSDPVSITVEEAIVESRFQRHVCIMEFTGTWCAQCPEGATTLNYLVNKAYKDKAFALAFHNADEYSITQEQELYKMFKWSGYPAYVTDMRDCGLLNEGGCSSSIEKSLYDVPTHCAAAVECHYDSTLTQVNVEAKIFSEKTMDYRLAAYVIEDKVVGKQTLSTGEIQEDYIHRHMVRKMLSADVRGDKLGNIQAENEATKTYCFKMEKSWNIENLAVAVLAINKDGEVNNMAICPADGGKMNYIERK